MNFERRDDRVTIPREYASSLSPSDYLWVSPASVTILEPFKTPDEIYTMAKAAWCPGLVVTIPSGLGTPTTIQSLARSCSVSSRQLGKARRISVGCEIPPETIRLLYESFQCVEFCDANRSVKVLDDRRGVTTLGEPVGAIDDS
jgi:hypothetical protein